MNHQNRYQTRASIQFQKKSRPHIAKCLLSGLLVFFCSQPPGRADENIGTPATESAQTSRPTPEMPKPFPIDTTSPISQAITALIAGRQNSLLTQPDFSRQAEQLANLYQKNNNQLLWLGVSPSRTNIEQALAILNNAGADGLDPAAYDADVLKQHIRQGLGIPQTATAELSKFDTALSIALLRFINDLHHGRVSPRQLDYPMPFGDKQQIDSAGLIAQAIAQQTLPQLPQSVQPKFKQYRQLKQILAGYRQTPQPATRLERLTFEKPLRPGEHHPQLAELKNRLILLGLLAADSDGNGAFAPRAYSKPLQEAVKRFQQQNALKADGIIGIETAALLNQSLAEKILLVELAMEKLRWVPDNISGPMIIVNIPAFQLWAFKSVDDPDALNMKVIVGQALKNQTPVLFEEMKYIEFMPYWNIPKSIMTKEILPKLNDDFAYLQEQDIELVKLDSNATTSIYDDILHGRVRARQRPGKNNPLGKVKFIFPNTEDVYLHDTSTPNLFNKSQRDLSHGCVRVSGAEKLAEFVLSIQPETVWDITSIQSAMSGNKTRRVNLKKPIPVLFFYSTAFVDPDNQIHFYRDIYEQDAALEKALGKVPASENGSLLTARTGAPG